MNTDGIDVRVAKYLFHAALKAGISLERNVTRRSFVNKEIETVEIPTTFSSRFMKAINSAFDFEERTKFFPEIVAAGLLLKAARLL